MRIIPLLLVALFLVSCVPEPEGKGIITDPEKDKVETQRLIGHAISGDPDLMGKSCRDDMECGLGRICVNSTCKPKQR